MALVLTENPQLEALVLELARAASGCDRSVLGKISNTVLTETWPAFRKRLAGLMDEAGLGVDEQHVQWVAAYKRELEQAREAEEKRQERERKAAEKRERTSAKQSESARVRAEAKAAAEAEAAKTAAAAQAARAAASSPSLRPEPARPASPASASRPSPQAQPRSQQDDWVNSDLRNKT